jgi:hypothetical protein
MYYLVDFKRKFDKVVANNDPRKTREENLKIILDKRDSRGFTDNPKNDYQDLRLRKKREAELRNDNAQIRRYWNYTDEQHKMKTKLWLETKKREERKLMLANRRLELQKKNNLPLTAQSYLDELESPIETDAQRGDKVFERSSTNYTNYLDKKDPSRIPVSETVKKEIVTSKGQLGLGKKALIGTALLGSGIALVNGINKYRKTRKDKGLRRGQYK